MAILPPMPLHLLQPSSAADGLRPATRQLLVGKRYRFRAQPTPTRWAMTPYSMEQHGPDFLFFWYTQVRSAGDHWSLFGPLAASPSQCFAAFSSVEILVCHSEDSRWQQGEALLMIAYGDDGVPGLRTRVHFWVPPGYRTPRYTLPMGRLLLHYYFTAAGYHLLEGRTPITNRLALRYITRLGFQLGAPIPNAEWRYTATGERTMGAVVPSYLTREMWEMWEEQR